jgi:peptidyl-prolyl cis-trans isomerase SurA
MAAALAAWLAGGGPAIAGQVFERVVVNVNGDILTRRQLDERVRSVLAQQQGRAVAPEDVRTDPVLREQAAALVPRVAADAVDELLVLQRARVLGFEATDDDVDRVIARMRLDNNIGSDQEFEGLLREQGIQSGALRESVRNQILVEQVRQDVFRRVGVTDPEADAYYRAHVREFAAGPAIVFREILVALPPLEDTRGSPAAAADYDRALIRFVKARDRVTRGESFADVARAESDAPSKTAGGAVGPVDPHTLPAPLGAALAKLSVGDVSAPVRTEEGYRLLKLESVAAPRPATFDTFRGSIIAELLARKQAAAFAAQLRQLRTRALLDWKDQTLKASYAGASGDR